MVDRPVGRGLGTCQRSEEHTSELQSLTNLVCRLLLEKKKNRNELLLNPHIDPIGLTLYMEPELGVRSPLSGTDTVERAIEFKLIIDKHFLADRLILASNVVFEPEWGRQNGERSKELKNEYSVGAAYRFAVGWYGGLELLNRRKFNDQDFAKQGASAFFLGPSLHYDQKEWWVTLTVLPQIAGSPVSDGSRTLGEYEKMEIRLRFGVDF